MALATAAMLTAVACGRSIGPTGPAGASGHGGAVGSSVPRSSRAAGTGATPFPGAQALGSLSNYAFRYTAAGLTVTGEVHSPSDWQTDQPIVERHVGGALYTQAAGTWVSVPEPAGAYNASPYPSSVQNLAALLRLPGAKATEGATCAVAGVAGHSFSIAVLQSQAFTERAKACVSATGGALLSADVAATGGAGAAAGLSWSFTMTAVGGVAALPAPATAG